jgi:hypothetical protein
LAKMKKTIWFFMLAVLSASMIPGASLTLIQPNGGELCLGQENFQIQWTAVGIDEKIKLVLFRNDVWIASIVENLNSAGSPYFWKVGQYIGGTALAGAGYKIRIRTMSNGIDDYSDAPFALKTSSPPCLPQGAAAAVSPPLLLCRCDKGKPAVHRLFHLESGRIHRQHRPGRQVQYSCVLHGRLEYI